MRMKHSKFMRMLLFSTLFALGMVTGGALMLVWSNHKLVRFFEQRQVTVHQKIFQRGVLRHVALNEQEKHHMEAVFKTHTPEYEAQLRQYEINMTPLRRRMIKRIGEGVRPAQRRELERWFDAKEKARWSRFNPPIDPTVFKKSK